MNKKTFYAVPEAIARELCLTKLRRSDNRGCFLLSQSDLRPYGIAKAVSEGARSVTDNEVQNMFNPLKSFNV